VTEISEYLILDSTRQLLKKEFISDQHKKILNFSKDDTTSTTFERYDKEGKLIEMEIKMPSIPINQMIKNSYDKESRLIEKKVYDLKGNLIDTHTYNYSTSNDTLLTFNYNSKNKEQVEISKKLYKNSSLAWEMTLIPNEFQMITIYEKGNPVKTIETYFNINTTSTITMKYDHLGNLMESIKTTKY
jgi:hypothetical protein